MPYSLSEEQIDFILIDIKARGIEIEKLQINLLDHVCCLLEEKMNEGDDFEKIYQEIIKEFYDANLKEIEKETKGVMRSKHYYKFKSFLYVLLIISLGYNIYGVTYYTVQYINHKKFIREHFIINGATLADGFKILTEKLKSEKPSTQLKDYTCICFLNSPMSLKERELFDYDSTESKGWESRLSKKYFTMDSLASIYNKNVDFVAAFQSKDDIIDKFILDQKSKTKSLIYLSDLNKLLSGYLNSKNIKVTTIPTVFVLDRTGTIVYDCKYPTEVVFFLSRYLKKFRDNS